MEPIDRRLRVRESSWLNGIDFVEVADKEQTLSVHLLNANQLQGTLTATITGGESIPTATVKDITDGGFDGDHRVLKLTVVAPGDFSNYTLTLKSSRLDSRIDPYFASSVFSFKAACPSDLDCRPPAVVCPPLEPAGPPIDYLAKDFLSFRQALLDFSAQNYPEWQERSEADFGVMSLEALCALADDLSYTQDRTIAEAVIETATQRRSLIRLARLVDYWAKPAGAATVLLQFNVENGTTGIPDGTVVVAQGPDGTPIPFETGTSLRNRLFDAGGKRNLQPPMSLVSPYWNYGVIRPYWFDDSQRCLRAGATQMYLLGAGFTFFGGQPLLIETPGPSSADPPVRQIVHLLDENPASESCDPLLLNPDLRGAPPPPVLYCPTSPLQGIAVTLIRWRPEDKLTDDRDLTITNLAGNLLNATHALTQTPETFIIPPLPPGQPNAIPAIVRTGPNDSPSDPSLQYLYTLRKAPLAWLHPEDPTQPPELVLEGLSPAGEPVVWVYLRWLLDAQPLDTAFTIDPVRYSRVAGTATDSLRYDYDGDTGDTVRLGGVFASVPNEGTALQVTYRVGGGKAGNVAAESITSLRSPVPGIMTVFNPLAARGGADPESLNNIRQLAPQAFQAVQYRAVLPADYQKAAETLPWVLRAGTVFRWTGSWLTVFTTPEPADSEQVRLDRRTELINLLNRYRMAGYESYVPDPKYVSLDVYVEACARPDAFRADVEQALLSALSAAKGGFFYHNNFTFGQALELSALEAAAQKANGLAGVTRVRYRIRGRTKEYVCMTDMVTVGSDEIIRCDNDPSLPEHGSLKVNIEGGK